ncbi:sulfatase-like hydrolase/transferase [Comamonas terrigena]|uniref:sulfatase-like hydrolase/transferase n=1 Tax=Comamonas terrigena TaxID=32013 RepID=UPI00289DC415|nr:sulfatase-like hydrolase/transferase [Comamonas terrigena]
MNMRPHATLAPLNARLSASRGGGWVTALAWLWLFLPLVWMWPSSRTLGDVALSALLWCGCLLWRPLTRVAAWVLVLVGACYLGYFYAVRSAPDEFFWYSVLGASTTEAWEYASSYRLQDLASLLCWLLPAVAAAVHLWRRAPLLTGRLLRGVGWTSWLVWGVLATTGVAKGYGLEGTLRRVDRVYPMTLGESYARYAHAAESIYRIPPMAPPAAAPMADVVVMVIGESASAQRWSLLGYQGNDTNAALRPWRDGLVTLPVTANGNNTGKTVPVLLTGQRMAEMPESGVVTVLDQGRAAGFRVETLSNQSASGMSLSFAHAAFRQRSDRFVNLQDGLQDGALTELLASSLQQQAAGQPALITLHMYGSHPRVNKRYPPEFAKWEDPYDNSIAYSSNLLADWISRLDALPGVRAALVYVSDHGQNFPQCGGSYTHGSTRSAYEVPLLVWGNAALRQQQPQWWGQLQKVAAHAVAPDGSLRQTNLLYTGVVQDLLGYQVHAVDKGTASHVSPAGDGPYPPTAAHNGCDDWFAQVAQQHPAATP